MLLAQADRLNEKRDMAHKTVHTLTAELKAIKLALQEVTSRERQVSPPTDCPTTPSGRRPVRNRRRRHGIYALITLLYLWYFCTSIVMHSYM